MVVEVLSARASRGSRRPMVRLERCISNDGPRRSCVGPDWWLWRECDDCDNRTIVSWKRSIQG